MKTSHLAMPVVLSFVAIALSAGACGDEESSGAGASSSSSGSSSSSSSSSGSGSGGVDSGASSGADASGDASGDASADASADASGDAGSGAGGGAAFPGHKVGKVYLGYGVDEASCPAGATLAEEEALTGPTTLLRWYEGRIDATTAEVKHFDEAFTSGRLAWSSFKEQPYTWKQIADGAADDTLKAKAVAFQAAKGPGLVTFHHEPSGDGTPAEYVAAWNRILDVWRDAGGTGPITPAPILNGFFQSFPNGGSGYTDLQMAEWIPDTLLARFRVIGFDGYDGGDYTSPGIPVARTVRKWHEWLLRRQAVIADGKRRYLALGEVGVFFAKSRASVTSWPTSADGEFVGGYPGWDAVWTALTKYGDGDGAYIAVNYFDSIKNTSASNDWSLRARRPTTGAADLACDSGNAQPPPGSGVADATRIDAFKVSLSSSLVAHP
ncbi:MAG: hypothetical protein U0270_44045 [Labilithrix sp.]